MKIGEIQILKKPLVIATRAEVQALAALLWITFPEGYVEYVTRLGEGVLGGSFVRIYPPWRIEAELAEWRRRIGKYWFWDASRAILPKERAVECVIVGDTLNGDELVFHPSRSNRLFVLPRDSEKVFEAGTNLLDAIEWMCSSGKLVQPFEERNFEPFDSRAKAVEETDDSGKVADPDGEALDDLVELGKRWAKRHNARHMGAKDLKPHRGADRNVELLYESIVIEGTFPHEAGYVVAWRIADKASGLELGVLQWHMNGASYGSSYEPNQANMAKLKKG